MMAVVLMAIGHDVATLHAQALTADTLSIRFRLDSIRIDMGYENNELHWNAFEQNFKKHFSHYSPASLRLDKTMMIAFVIACSAPTAASTTMFAAKFNRDVELSVGVVAASTILSIITMPLIVSLAWTIVY